jgi:hypothetical protein
MLPQVVEAEPLPKVTHAETDGRDRERANRLYREVVRLHSRLREAEKEKYPNALPFPNPRSKNLPEIQDMPVEHVAYHDLVELDDSEGPAAGDAVRKRIKEAAASDLVDGRRCRQMVTPECTAITTPYEDMLFIVTYDLLQKEWEPRGLSELLILQQMLQAHVAVQQWTQKLTRYSAGMCTTIEDEDQRAKYGEWVPPRMDAGLAVEYCSRMIVRFSNLYLKHLRALRDLRRYAVTINNPGQVNIGEKQINVSNLTS